jgi:antitoxin ParD1/3/4
MNISLTAEHEQFIQQKLQSGRYETVNDLLMQAFQLLEEWDETQEPLTAAQQQELDRRLDRYEQDPTTGTSWETLRSRLLNNAS